MAKSHRRICVVGAGPAGLAALKIISDAPQFRAGLWKVVAYEARDNFGGIWRPAPPTDDPPWTPLYDSLTTNGPHPIMSYTSLPFPPSTPVYPRAPALLTYLETYVARFELNSLIVLNTAVENARWISPSWRVRLSTNETLDFDFLVVANGHFRVPHYPDMPGLSHWLAAKRASHSAWYRRPHDFGAVVLVVGNGPSGQDISAEMHTAARVVVHSIRGATPSNSGNLKIRGQVSEFRPDWSVVFEDGSSETDIDHCILATGFELSFPFLDASTLQSSVPPLCPPLPHELHGTLYNVFPLAKHLFPLQAGFPPTSIAFMSHLRDVAPFPIYEAQAHAIVKVLEQPDALDVTQEAKDIVARYERLRAEIGDDPLSIAKRWTHFKVPEQYDYRDRLYAFSGIDQKSPEWMEEVYRRNKELRKVWRSLESTGEADDWVRGVGEGGQHEWVELLEKMMQRADEEKYHLTHRL